MLEITRLSTRMAGRQYPRKLGRQVWRYWCDAVMHHSGSGTWGHALCSGDGNQNSEVMR